MSSPVYQLATIWMALTTGALLLAARPNHASADRLPLASAPSDTAVVAPLQTPSASSSPRLIPPATDTHRKSATTARNDFSPQWIATRLGIVLGVFLGLVILQRIWLPTSAAALPRGAIQVCGKVALDAKRSLHLVRIGTRLLVLLESPQGMQPLAEITDPDEVRGLLESGGRSPAQQQHQRRREASDAGLPIENVLARFRQEGQVMQ